MYFQHWICHPNQTHHPIYDGQGILEFPFLFSLAKIVFGMKKRNYLTIPLNVGKKIIVLPLNRQLSQ